MKKEHKASGRRHHVAVRRHVPKMWNEKRFRYTHSDFASYGTCDICKIFGLRDANITSLKVVGREGSSESKVKSIMFAKSVVNDMAGADSYDTFPGKARLRFQKIFKESCDRISCGYKA